jgi:hypothetical protein
MAGVMVNPLQGPDIGEAIMWSCQKGWTLLGAVLMFTVLLSPPASAGDKAAAKQPVKVAGILIDKQADWLTVKADGEEEPVKYLIDKSNKALVKSLKPVFNAGRVQLSYKEDGDARQLVSIKKQILRKAGTVTGTVVKVYNDFWVEVKPKSGPSDAYAPGANYKDKAFMERLRGLKPGDSVTIRFTTDSERHRILSLRKN